MPALGVQMAAWEHFRAPGPSKWSPLGAAEVAFGAQDAQFGSLWAPKVLKMEPFGTPLGAQICILEPVGSTFNQMLIYVCFSAHSGGHFGACWGSFWRILGTKRSEKLTQTPTQNRSEKQHVFQPRFHETSMRTR